MWKQKLLPITPVSCIFITSSLLWGLAWVQGLQAAVCNTLGQLVAGPGHQGGGAIHLFSPKPGTWQEQTDFVEKMNQHVSACRQPFLMHSQLVFRKLSG